MTPRADQHHRDALAELAALLPANATARDCLIENLHVIQDRYDGLSRPHLRALAEIMRLGLSEVFETATFYAHFRVLAEGETAAPAPVRVCGGPICRQRGGDLLLQSTHAEEAPCLGLCDHAPAALAGAHPVRRADAAAIAEALARPAETAFSTLESYGAFAPRRHSRDAVLAELEAAGLRGMGGAGFPTPRKWQTVAAQPGPRLVVVNADEGEPGTFKDRYFLETAPLAVLEGALTAAWVIGAEAVYIYLRDEYPDLHRALRAEIAEIERRGLNDGITLHLRRGAGAYVCGEESALIESLEGKRGLPRQRPPYVAEVGLFGRPTLVNNVETLYWVTTILKDGATAFAAHGRNGHHGLRAYSVSGRVRQPGVKIAPNGITITELIEEFCGGMETGHTLTAYLPGGASGGFLPAHLQPPLTFGAIEPYGGFIGSAAVMVLSQADDLRETARILARFFADESCGQCTPCRLGTAKAAALLEQPRWNAEVLDDLAFVMRQASICGLGQAAPNVWQSLHRHFPEFRS
ncbi:NADH:ubiquinone oxidoreductase [Candidatus Terasakiella magnetica]|nr:NADH:ubiquinone oxidoreductase [Candidatus Terasakiella magnetica]